MLNACSQSGIFCVDIRFARYFLIEIVKELKNAINYDTPCKVMERTKINDFFSKEEISSIPSGKK